MKAVPGQTELPQLQKLQRGELQPADDALVTIQPPTENTLSQQRGFAFTRTQYKPMPILFFINWCLLSFFLLENGSSKFLLHLSFISYIDIYLIYCMSQVGEEAFLSIFTNREELNEKPYCSSGTICSQLPARHWYPMEIHWYPSHCYKHSFPSKSHIWVLLQGPRQHFTIFFPPLLLDFWGPCRCDWIPQLETCFINVKDC